MIYECVRRLLKLYYRIKCKITYIGTENIPQKGGFIAACNHQSYSDPPLLATAIKGRKFSFMAKSELFQKNKLFKWLITALGAFPVERGAGDTGAIDRAISDLEKGKVFVIFPEGTRSKDGTIGRAKSGVTLIASKANAAVVPFCIKYGEKKGRQHITISAGKLIPAEKMHIPEGDRKALKKTSALIMDNIKTLMDEIDEA